MCIRDRRKVQLDFDAAVAHVAHVGVVEMCIRDRGIVVIRTACGENAEQGENEQMIKMLDVYKRQVFPSGAHLYKTEHDKNGVHIP